MLSMTKSTILKSLTTVEMKEEIAFHEIYITFVGNASLACNHPYNDIYPIFPFEAMHHISSGLLKMLHNCIIRLLFNNKRTTKAMILQTGSARNFKQMKEIHIAT